MIDARTPEITPMVTKKTKTKFNRCFFLPGWHEATYYIWVKSKGQKFRSSSSPHISGVKENHPIRGGIEH